MSQRSSYTSILRAFLLLIIFLLAAYICGDLLTDFKQQAITQSGKALYYSLQCAIWLASAYFVNTLFNLIFWDRMFAALFGDNQVPRLLKNVTGILIFAIAVTGIVGVVFQKPITGIWATSGVVGIVLGLALQSMIRDIFVGLAVNIDKPYGIGDFITVHPASLRKDAGVRGLVQEINWRTTKLLTPEENTVYVPNSVIGASVLTNHSAPKISHEIKLNITLGFDVEPARAKRILLAAALAAADDNGPVLATPPPKVRIVNTQPEGVDYRISFMAARSPGPAKDLLLSSVLDHLHQAGLSLSYPQQDIYLANMPQRDVESTSLPGRIKLLQRVEIFSPLHEEELQFLVTAGVEQFIQQDKRIFSYGDSSAAQDYSMFVLVEGLLYASVEQEGDSVRVGQIVPGEVFGEMSLLTGVARSATVTAATDAVIYEITQKAMAELLQRRPALMHSLSEIMAERRLRNEQVNETQAQGAATETRSSLAMQLFGSMKRLFGRI